MEAKALREGKSAEEARALGEAQALAGARCKQSPQHTFLFNTLLLLSP